MRVYRIVNLVILGLLLYVPVFALVSPRMEEILPSMWRCSCKELTGKPCPFCGLTGDMGTFLASGETSHGENGGFSVLLEIYLGFLILRTVFTPASYLAKRKTLPWLDAGSHLVFLLTVFLF